MREPSSGGHECFIERGPMSIRLCYRFLSAICERFRMFRFFDVSRISIINDDDGERLRKDFSYKRNPQAEGSASFSGLPLFYA